MKISIREVTLSPLGLKILRVYAPRTRKDALPGTAHETKSGYWIVNIPGQIADVAECEGDAAFQLAKYYEPKKSAW